METFHLKPSKLSPPSPLAENANASSSGDETPGESRRQDSGDGGSSGNGHILPEASGAGATAATAKEKKAQEERDVVGKLQQEAVSSRPELCVFVFLCVLMS